MPAAWPSSTSIPARVTKESPPIPNDVARACASVMSARPGSASQSCARLAAHGHVPGSIGRVDARREGERERDVVGLHRHADDARLPAAEDQHPVTGDEVPLARQPALHHDLVAAARVATLDHRIAAPAVAEHDVQDPLARAVAVRAQADVLLLAPVGARLDVRQRADALVDGPAVLAVEAGDHVGQVGLRRGSIEAGREPEADGRRGPDHECGGEDAEQREQPAAAGHAATSRPCSSRSTRSAIAAAPASCVTSTIARPSSSRARAAARARRRRPPRRGCRSARRPAAADGSLTSARAIAKRCCSPPESWCGSDSATVAQSEPVDQRAAARERLRLGAADPRREQHVRLAAQLGQQVEELEDEADMPPPQRRQPPLAGAGDALAADLDGPRLGAVEPAEHVQQRRLAGAGAPEHRDDLAGLDVEVGAIEDPARRASRSERPDQPARCDDRHRLHGRAYAARAGAARDHDAAPARPVGGRRRDAAASTCAAAAAGATRCS